MEEATMKSLSKMLAAAAALAGLLAAPLAARAEVKVVATVPDLAAIAKAVGGDKVSVVSLALPTQDPHFVDAKPSLVLQLNRADLLIAVGLELEIGWLPTLQRGARNGAILSGGRGYLECAAYVHKLEVATAAVDRSQGDIHPSGNPHYLYDPRAAAGCASGIAARLVELDPGNGKTYQENVERFVKELEQKRVAWEQRLAKYKGSPLITYHRSWSYLLDWLGLVDVETLEPKPGIPPTPRHVADVLKTGRARNVKVILQESFYPDKTGKLVAEKLGGTVLLLPGGTDFNGGETFLAHMDEMVTAIEKALGK
jgi:zinc/manganese transport system substrate-binding protein